MERTIAIPSRRIVYFRSMFYSFKGFIPVVHPTSFVHPLAVVTGNVIIGKHKPEEAATSHKANKDKDTASNRKFGYRLRIIN